MAASDLDARLADVARQYDDLQAELALPETAPIRSRSERLGKELARLEPVVAAFRRLEATRSELAGARELRDAGDGDEELQVDGRATRSTRLESRRDAPPRRAARSSSCRATRTTTAT